MNKPFMLRPAYKDYLWGGDTLKSKYSINTDLDVVAEAWLLSGQAFFAS